MLGLGIFLFINFCESWKLNIVLLCTRVLQYSCIEQQTDRLTDWLCFLSPIRDPQSEHGEAECGPGCQRAAQLPAAGQTRSRWADHCSEWLLFFRQFFLLPVINRKKNLSCQMLIDLNNKKSWGWIVSQTFFRFFFLFLWASYTPTFVISLLLKMLEVGRWNSFLFSAQNQRWSGM